MPQMMHRTPARKVVASSLGAPITLILFYLLKLGFPEHEPPNEIVAAVTTVISFLLGYYVPPSARDQVVVGPVDEAEA